MANTDKVVVTKSKLVAIADAIRAKNSTSDKMSLDSIPGIIANLKTGGDLSETTVELNLASGDQSVFAPAGTRYSKITISKPATLLPANIASGVEIAGVMGTANVNGTKARLNAPTISWNGSSSTLTITNPSTNGNFADGYYIYKDGVKADTYTYTLGQGTSYSYNMDSIGDNVTAVFTATIWASDMVESDKPASITYGHYTVTQTLSSHLQSDSAPTGRYHNQPITETISVAATEGSEQTALTPTVTNPSSSSYTFAIPDGQTYYESTNKGKPSTYAYGKFAFTATTACRVYVQYVSSGEPSFDFGIISKADKDLSQSANEDASSDLVAVNAKGNPSTETKTVCIGDVDAGDHYFTAKFRKDGSGDQGNDSLRIIGIYFNSLTFPEHIYLPTNIECTYVDGTVPDYTWDPFTGALSIPKVQGKLTITITESNMGPLRPSTLTRKKTVLTWTAVANATTYEIHAFSDSMTDRAIYTGTDLTFDFSTVITEEGKYTIYVVAKADGFQDSPTTGASRLSFNYNPNVPFDDVLANNTWEDIAEACSLGMAADLWKVGDEKTVTLTNGKEYTIQIADLTEGRYKTASGDSCHATFIFKNCSESDYKWNGVASNTGGWPSSEMRNTVMKNILALIPAELADFLLSVKITSNGGSNHPAADLASDGDKFFLPSVYEIYGDDPNNFNGWGAGYFKDKASYTGETAGGQFGLFATYTSGNDFRRAPLSNPTSYQYWWLRSPNHSSSNNVLIIHSAGSISNSYVSHDGHVVPCFAM
jgi:hypothetical protein